MINIDRIKKFEDDKTVLKAVVKICEKTEDGKYRLITELLGNKVIIPHEEIDTKDPSSIAISFVSKKIPFIIINIDEENQVIFGSRRIVKEVERDNLIPRLEAGEVFDAKIKKILKYGAYLDIEGTSVFMRNQDFASDYSNIGDVLREGNSVKVKLNKITNVKRIQVEAVEKYFCKDTVNFEDFKPESVISGKVVSCKAFGTFVRIAQNLDAICAPSPNLPVEEGDKVLMVISEIIPEERRVRGYIKRVLPYEIDNESY